MNIIFDWSGTLNDNFNSFCQVYELMTKELKGKSLTKEEIRNTFTIPYMKFWNLHFPNLTMEKQCKLYKKFIHQVEEPELYTNAQETIEYLHSKGHNLFIVSSDPISKLIPEIKKSLPKNIFTEIIGEVHEKSTILTSLINNHNLDKNKTFHVGDTSGDVEAGKIAKIKTIAISWGFQNTKNLTKSNPDFLIDDIIEIKEVIFNTSQLHESKPLR